MTSIRLAVLGALLTSGCGGTFNSRPRGCPEYALCPPPPGDTGDVDTGAEDLAPMAVCSVDDSEQSLPDALFAFDGSPSFSPDGGELVGFEWSILTKPETSVAVLSSRTGETTVLEGDAVGAYEVQLNVINELGYRSDEPCIIRVHVVDEAR